MHLLNNSGRPAVSTSRQTSRPTSSQTADRSVWIDRLESRTLFSAAAVAASPAVPLRTITAADDPAVLTLTGPSGQSVLAGITKGFRVGSFTAVNSSGPFVVTINWGDGKASHNTVNNVGGIPLGVHTYPKAGKYTVTESIADALGNVSNTVSYLLTVIAPATISGRVYIDANHNGKMDAGEAGLKSKIYFDYNNNGKVDGLDYPIDLTDGKFSFVLLAPGTYYLHVIPASGYVPTNPLTNSRKITVVAGQVSLGNNFGEKKK